MLVGYFLSKSIAIAQFRVAVRELFMVLAIRWDGGVRRNGPVSFRISTGSLIVVHTFRSG